MTVVNLLHDTHVLILMTESESKVVTTLRRLFEAFGAVVHTAQTQHEGIGLYWSLYRAGIRPKVVVSSWSLVPQESEQFRYLQMLNRQKEDGTALNFLLNVTEMDDTALLTVYTKDPELARTILSERGVPAEVFSKTEIDPAAFVCRIATHEGVSKQRADPVQVVQEIRRMESSRRMATASSCLIMPTPG